MRIAVLILAFVMVNALKMKTEGAFPDAVPSHLICYSKKKLKGEAISVTSNVRNLEKDTGYVQDFNDTISSCSVTGIWILYDQPGFEGKINAIFGEDSSFIPSLSGDISSIRKIESNHKISNELVLFKEPLFQKTRACNVLRGMKFPVNCPTVRSAIVKGFVDWTIVSEVSDDDYYTKTVSVCLKASRNGAAFFGTLDSKTIGSVKSIKQGCKGQIILEGEAQITDEDDQEIKKKDCGCNSEGVLDGDTGCNDDGLCSCDFDRHFTGDKCYECEHGFYLEKNVCKDCQCISIGSDGCEANGDCICWDPSFTGRKCNTKKIEVKNFQPKKRKSIRVTCLGPCGKVSLHVKITDNVGKGKVQLKVGGGIGGRCDSRQIAHEKNCKGTVRRSRSFTISLTNRGSSCNIILKIFATKLLNAR